MSARRNMTDRYVNGHVQRRVKHLRAGDRVDLEYDKYADKDGSHPEYAFEFETVATTELETPNCLVVTFESGAQVGFPPEHWVDVDGEQIRKRGPARANLRDPDTRNAYDSFGFTRK